MNAGRMKKMQLFKKDSTRFTKAVALIFTVLLLFTFIISAYFVAEESAHQDCTGENCPVCQTIVMCLNNIRMSADTGACFLIPVLCMVLLCVVSIIRSYDFIGNTLVKQKVRLEI